MTLAPRAWTLLTVLASLGGCTDPPPHQSDPPRPQPDPNPAVLAPPLAPTSDRFWVGEDGLKAYDLDGKQVATLGDVGDRALRLPDGRIVALQESPFELQPLQLFVLAPDGRVTLRATVPNVFQRESCAVTPPPADVEDERLVGLSVQSDQDFSADPISNHACLAVQDRNDNMANHRVLVAVDLATGTSQSVVEVDLAGHCRDFGEIAKATCAHSSDGEPWIELASTSTSVEEVDWPYSFDEDTRWISNKGQRRSLLCSPGAEPDNWMACSNIESSSPSGRYLLLSGRWTEGDYIHRDVVLLDRSTGELLQVETPRKAPATFVKVRPEQIFAADPTFPSLDMVGESDVGWMPKDRLWIDGSLLIPERLEIVEIGGHRARAQ
jgi:hypothetical protein